MPRQQHTEPRIQAALTLNGVVYAGDVLNESETGLEVLVAGSSTVGAFVPGTIVECNVQRNNRAETGEALIIKAAHNHVWLRVPSGWMQQERRAFRRRIGGFQVECVVAGARHESLCLDIAPGGLRLIASHAPAVMTRLDVEFALPDSAHTRVHTEAMVLYVLPCDSIQGSFEFGLKFSRLAPADGLRLASFCSTEHRGDRALRACA